MKKVNNKKGFTLAELLVVIAILAILVAIAAPIFAGALSKAEDTVKEANLRSAQSAAMVEYLLNEESGAVKYTYTINSTTKDVDLTRVGAATASDTSEATTKNAGTVVIGD